ncbi:MAG: hypothetical protein Q9161_004085 [Pseudevernia consocians]
MAQHMQDSAAELGIPFRSNHWPDEAYDNGPHYRVADLAGPNVAYDQGNNAVGNAGYGSNSTHIINDDRGGFYGFNNLADPSPAYGVGNNTAQNVDLGAHGPCVDDSLCPFGTMTAPGHSGGNYTVQNAVNGGLSRLSGLIAPIGDYRLGNYASEGGINSGLYPVNDIAVYDGGNSTGLAAYPGTANNSVHRVDNSFAPNPVYNQGNHAGLNPYLGNADEGFYPVDDIAYPSAIRHESDNARYDPNAATIYDGLFPFTGLSAVTTAYDGANSGAQMAGFSPQALSLTAAVDSTLPPSATSGSGMDPNGRPRWACNGCVKTFSRRADMERHAKKHSGVLQYQCNVTGCPYPGSYRQDKLDQHRRNCH